MKYERANNSNNKGIEQVQKTNDPLVKRIFMINESTDNKLNKLSFDEKRSKSEIVREALNTTLNT
ncbi:MAG: hypothetical protein KAS93_08210 [Gammaproteobacteria bacterium]|nr:hypothetical protein [Gammaproteobacteria bacterium]